MWLFTQLNLAPREMRMLVKPMTEQNKHTQNLFPKFYLTIKVLNVLISYDCLCSYVVMNTQCNSKTGIIKASDV